MYDRYFGFSKRPFTDLADQAFLTIPPYRAAYTCLRRGLLERCGLLLLTGIPGTGKTTLLHHLMADLEDQAHCIFFWNTHLGFGDLLDYVCSDLGLHSLPTGQAEKFQALEACLRTQFAEGGEVVLMLDDAQNLPDETLDGLYQLTQLEMVGRPLLQIVLSGQPVLESRLAELPALQSLGLDAGAHCRLDALER